MKKSGRHPWRYTLEATELYVKSAKAPANNETGWKSSRRNNPQHKQCLFPLYLKNMPFQPASQLYKASGLLTESDSFSSALVLDNNRVRGIDYNLITNRQYFDDNRKKIKSWHENIIYYSPNENKIINEHSTQGFETFNPSDLESFHRFCCHHWNIEIPEEEGRLL